jgi:hypothetical protein
VNTGNITRTNCRRRATSDALIASAGVLYRHCGHSLHNLQRHLERPGTPLPYPYELGDDPTTAQRYFSSAQVRWIGPFVSREIAPLSLTNNAAPQG